MPWWCFPSCLLLLSQWAQMRCTPAQVLWHGSPPHEHLVSPLKLRITVESDLLQFSHIFHNFQCNTISLSMVFIWYSYLWYSYGIHIYGIHRTCEVPLMMLKVHPENKSWCSKEKQNYLVCNIDWGLQLKLPPFQDVWTQPLWKSETKGNLWSHHFGYTSMHKNLSL